MHSLLDAFGRGLLNHECNYIAKSGGKARFLDDGLEECNRSLHCFSYYGKREMALILAKFFTV